MTLSTVANREKPINGYSREDTRLIQTVRGQSRMRCLLGLQIFTLVFILATIVSLYCIAVPVMREWKNSKHTNKDNLKKFGNVSTLYALDPLAHSLSFGDGKYGEIFDKSSVYNRRSELDFNTYKNGSFSTGVEGAQRGVIIDLGTGEQLRNRYKYQDTVGSGQGFASIHRKGETLFILKNLPYERKFQPMTESAELFRDGQSTASAPIALGHFYLVRLIDPNEAGFERLVKMIVIAYEPNQWVTIRWSLIE